MCATTSNPLMSSACSQLLDSLPPCQAGIVCSSVESKSTKTASILMLLSLLMSFGFLEVKCYNLRAQQGSMQSMLLQTPQHPPTTAVGWPHVAQLQCTLQSAAPDPQHHPQQNASPPALHPSRKQCMPCMLHTTLSCRIPSTQTTIGQIALSPVNTLTHRPLSPWVDNGTKAHAQNVKQSTDPNISTHSITAPSVVHEG